MSIYEPWSRPKGDGEIKKGIIEKQAVTQKGLSKRGDVTPVQDVLVKIFKRYWIDISNIISKYNLKIWSLDCPFRAL